MAIEQKRFSGVMNLDDRPEFVLANQHIDALNLRFYGGPNGLVAENMPGNTLITNNNLPDGSNQCIGSFYDSLKQRIIWFNWNSTGRNGIYQYTLSDNTITPLLISFVDSQEDIFDFDLDYPVASINIIYTTEEDGDILTWVARNNRPKELNIKNALDNLYGANWKAEYLDVAKAPPSIPIVCAFENDNTATVNNLKGPSGCKLYRFKYRFVYGTFQKSTWSTISEIPIPLDYTLPATITDPTKNCRIGLIFQTGTTDVLQIELAAQELSDQQGVNDFGDFFLIQALDKAELSIPDDDSYTWAFYNNEAYDFIDVRESILGFDRVPNKANTQELLNGNVIVYGGITEGYDPVVPDVTMNTTAVSIGYPDTAVRILATQNGLNGGDYPTDTGDIRISLVGIPVSPPAIIGVSGVNSFVEVRVLAGGNYYVINATGATGDTLADMIADLSTSASGQGFTIVSTSANSLVIRRTGQTLVNYYGAGAGADVRPVNNSIPCSEYGASYNYGIVYFDEKGKNNGVTTSEDFHLTIPYIPSPYQIGSALNLYRSDMLIYHRPPLWAKTYQIVRTKNLTKENFVSLVSDRTFKDATFAYISIEGLARYKAQYPTSVVSFDFVVGDRIKFVCLFNSDKTVNTSYGNTRDYEIVDQVVNPTLDGVVQEGTFVKINLPTTSATFDFGDITSNAYYYYYIELYTPAKSVANGLDVYYECSEMFQIGNAGTIYAFHQGTQGLNQDPGGGPAPATPATVWIQKGDNYCRNREIRAGASFVANTVPDVTYVWANEPVYQQTIPIIPVGTSYEVKNTTSGATTNPNNFLIKTGLFSVSFTVKGSIRFRANQGTPNNLFVYMLYRNIGGGGTGLDVLATKSGGVSNGEIFSFDIDTGITVPALRTAVIYVQESPVSSPTPFSANSISGTLSFVDTEHDFTINVVDANFSDFFPSKVNNNGRPSVINKDEKELYYPTLLRWGLSYQQNTNINQINRFFEDTFDEVDRSKGDIQRFRTRDRLLRVFQNRAVGQYGVFAKFIQSNTGVPELTTTNDILTKGNINYYQGDFGLGDQYTGLVSSKRADYLDDPVRGYEVRLSGDGMTPISELYKGQFYIRNLILPYNQTYLRPDGSKAKILGTYDYFNEEKITFLQSGTKNGTTIPGYAFSFNETRNGYSSFFSYTDAEWLEAAEDLIYTWKEGRLWRHDNTTTYCNYYTVQHEAYITLVFNINFLEVKQPMSVTEVASQIWRCPIVYTNVPSYGSQRQESELKDVNFTRLEGEFKAAFLRDIHSRGGWINGSFLKGSYLVAKFQIDTPTSVVRLSEVSVMWKDSPLNIK